MSGRDLIPSSHTNGEDVFQELITRLNRFILPDDITLGQIRGFGGFAEVFEASMIVNRTGESRRVAVKRFRVVLKTTAAFAEVLFILLGQRSALLIAGQYSHSNERFFSGNTSNTRTSYHC